MFPMIKAASKIHLTENKPYCILLIMKVVRRSGAGGILEVWRGRTLAALQSWLMTQAAETAAGGVLNRTSVLTLSLLAPR